MLTRVRNQDQKGFYTVEKPCAYRREGSKIKCFYIGRGGSLSFLKVGFFFILLFIHHDFPGSESLYHSRHP